MFRSLPFAAASTASPEMGDKLAAGVPAAPESDRNGTMIEGPDRR
jgi:hypothetical protein